MTRATILAGIGGGVVAVLLLAPATGTALGELARARAARADAVAQAAAPIVTPLPLITPALRVAADGEPVAVRAVAARVRTLAAQGGVLVEQARVLPGGGGLVRLRLRLSGADKAVVALADRLEREAPLIRFDRWQVTALSDDELRLEGEAVGAWR